METKLGIHIMPWEIDYFTLMLIKLKNGKKYIPENFNIDFDVILNLSSYIIDWNRTAFPKKYFIEKYLQLKSILNDFNVTRYDIYDDDKLYGHLDFQKESIGNKYDGYFYICPDINFNEFLLPQMCESILSIKSDNYVLTSEIYKMWDYTWDIITNERYISIPYSDYKKKDSFDLQIESMDYINDISLSRLEKFKFAGWFDYYSKGFIEDIFAIPDEWHGYGPWDLYCLLIFDFIKKNNIAIDITQYILKNQIVHSYENDSFKGLSSYYKSNMAFNDIPNQRISIESKMEIYIKNWYENYRKKLI